MKKTRIIIYSAGAILYAVIFACLFEFSRRTAYVWSFLEEDSGIGRIVSGDTKMILTGFALGLIPGIITVLLAARVRAYWTLRLRTRTVRISALVVMLIVNALALLYLGSDVFISSRRYLSEREQIDNIRNMLAREQRIYHAGGGVTGPDGIVYNYTNSREAFQQSLDRDEKFVELDFRFTTDGELVCIHNWKKDFVKPDGTLAEGQVSLEEFLQGKIQGHFTPMTVEEVAGAMREHPDLHIVVDLKGDDVIEGYRVLAQKYPDLMPRLIPQFYHAVQFDYLYGLGYRAMIFTLYRTSEWERSEASLNSFAMRQMLVGITMGTYRIDDGGTFLRQVLKTRQPVYIHTVDDPARQQELFDMGVSAVYTNVLA